MFSCIEPGITNQYLKKTILKYNLFIDCINWTSAVDVNEIAIDVLLNHLRATSHGVHKRAAKLIDKKSNNVTSRYYIIRII